MSLPAEYGENEVVLLVQGPHVVFAYWELTPATWQALTRRGTFTVRFWRQAPAGGCCDVYPAQRVGNWYFRDVAAGASYICEVGCTEDGVFYPFLRSAPVTTPFDAVVPAADYELVGPVFEGEAAPEVWLNLPGSGR